MGSPTRRLRRLPTLLLAGGIWIVLVAGATGAFMRVERRPGRELAVRPEWPAESHLVRPTDQQTLILIAHPRCPCTRASLEQLARIVTRTTRPFRGYALFLRPPGTDAAWTHTASWDQAAEIPGFLPVEDRDGAEARLFGASTSGHVFLYDAEGTLRFAGGITAARGTEGPSAGLTSVLDALNGHPPLLSRTPVFGCPLGDSEGDR